MINTQEGDIIMLEKIKKSGKLPLVIGISVALIIIIVVAFAITAETNGYGTPIIFGGIAALRGIWKQN